MSQTEETPNKTEEPEAASAPVADLADELDIVDAMKPAPAPTSNNKPLRYGTRRKKTGESAPVITNISAAAGIEEEEEIEMDDLPIRANVSEELIDTRKAPSENKEDEGEGRPRRQNRSRGERRGRKPRERAPETNEEESTEAEAAEEPAVASSERPARFGTVSQDEQARHGESQVQEFRPSRDGRTSPKRERKPKAESSRPARAPQAKKKGLLSKILAFFTGGEKEESKPQERKGRSGNGNRRGGRGRNPQGRAKREGEGPEGEGGNRRRRRRPRNRKPRATDEKGSDNNGGNRPEGSGNRRRRRPRRPRRERQESSAE